MICERCGDNVMAGQLVVRRTFEGFACHPCADEVKRTKWEARNMTSKNGSAKRGNVVAKHKATARKSADGGTSLAALIDPMLLSGGRTIKEISAELAKKAGDAAQGKDLQANVRARLHTYRRKGWQVEKDNEKRVKIVQKT